MGDDNLEITRVGSGAARLEDTVRGRGSRTRFGFEDTVRGHQRDKTEGPSPSELVQ